jgi:hypothetical protein
MRRTLAAGAAALGAWLAVAAAAPAAPLALVPVGSFVNPAYVTAPRDDPSRLFVVERGGTVRVVRHGAVLPR